MTAIRGITSLQRPRLLSWVVRRKRANLMRRGTPHVIAVLLGVLAAGLPVSRAQEKSDLAPPFAVQAAGTPIDVRPDQDGRTEYDNAFPWFGDLDGDGKPDLLVGQR